MPLKLKVPFEEKDEVKTLVAWWNQVHKCWNIPDHVADIDKLQSGYPSRRDLSFVNRTSWL
jgi:hypothetical protein